MQPGRFLFILFLAISLICPAFPASFFAQDCPPAECACCCGQPSGVSCCCSPDEDPQPAPTPIPAPAPRLVLGLPVQPVDLVALMTRDVARGAPAPAHARTHASERPIRILCGIWQT